ncbi:MAG: hypothetical protein IPJ88_13630 [Myxococcales bacterium]|nr:MAG: hypothetical protein IPJ88_13630 [Myxococcales bacterium]
MIKLSGSLVVISVIAFLGFAQAQEDTTQQTPAPAPAATDNSAINQGNQVVSQGQSLARRIANMLDEARREGDVIRATCLDDKLTQANVNTRNAEQRLSALQEAVSTQDNERQKHELTVLSVLSSKLGVLDQEAAQCLGQDLFETGETKVVTTIDPNTPQENSSIAPPPSMPVVPAVPPPSSPTN